MEIRELSRKWVNRMLFLAFTLCSSATYAYPIKPVVLVVGFPPGGSTDLIARLLAKGLSERLNQPFTVENRPGATGTVATAQVARTAPDGYTLLFAAAGHTTAPSLFKLSYDPVNDFSPISLVASVTNVLVVHPSVPAHSVQELIQYAKTNPGKLNFASAGNGSINHFAGELFKTMAGVDLVHVPYKGSGAAMSDLLSGNVQVAFDQMPSSLPHARTGKLRALAVTSAVRSKAAPDLPTIDELGFPGYEAISWNGVFAPAKTPQSIIQSLYKAIAETMRTDEVNSRLADIGADPVGSSPESFTAFVRSEISKWAKIAKAARVKVD